MIGKSGNQIFQFHPSSSLLFGSFFTVDSVTDELPRTDPQSTFEDADSVLVFEDPHSSLLDVVLVSVFGAGVPQSVVTDDLLSLLESPQLSAHELFPDLLSFAHPPPLLPLLWRSPPRRPRLKTTEFKFCPF